MILNTKTSKGIKMSYINNSLKEIFDSWRNYLNESTEKQEQLGKKFASLFLMKHKSTRDNAISLMKDSIELYKKLLSLPIEDKEYLEIKRMINSDPTFNISDQEIKDTILSLESIKSYIEEENQKEKED